MSSRALHASSAERPGTATDEAPGRLTVRLVTEPEKFASLRAAWNAIDAASPCPRLFLQHEWFDAAWRWRRQAAQLHLLCLLRDDELVAVLPLVREDIERRGHRIRELSFLTVPDTQACDLIVAARNRGAAVETLTAELVRRKSEWDVLRLSYLPPASIAATSLREALAGRGVATRLEGGGGNAYVRLDSSWEAYYAARSRSLKKANNLAANRLKKAGEVRIDWLEPGSNDARRLGETLDRIVAISAASWKRHTGNSLENPGPQAFIRRLSELARERGWLSVWTLTLDGRPLAMEYQLLADGRVFALRSDFDATFDELSPGSHLNRHLLERLFGRGLSRYCMGLGDNAYKQRWADDAEPVLELSAYGRTLTGRWLALWETSLKPVARRLRDCLTRSQRQTATQDEE